MRILAKPLPLTRGTLADPRSTGVRTPLRLPNILGLRGTFVR